MYRTQKQYQQGIRPDSLKHHHPVSFGGSYFNVQVASVGERTAQWAAMANDHPSGFPAVDSTWVTKEKKRNLSWQNLPRPFRRPSSPVSVSATASDGRPPSLVMDGTESRTTTTSTNSSSIYTGTNSVVYATHTPDPRDAAAQIHALLDANYTSLMWDVRTEPRSLTVSHHASQLYGPNALSFPLTSTGAGHIRIYSKQFPWCIDIGPKMRAITASEALRAIYDLLNSDIDDAVWGLANDDVKTSVGRAWEARKKMDPTSTMKKVDWLGKQVMFRGFCRDNAFVQRRLRPGIEPVAETWLVSFCKPQ